jgi:predicted unusual protein kinase regulating ubiquinone biosynthesis (AarF/ABC1/UbiB family)
MKLGQMISLDAGEMLPAELTAILAQLREAAEMRRFRVLLSDDERFAVPEPLDDLLRPTVLPMDYIPGELIETMEQASPDRRNGLARGLVDLVLRDGYSPSATRQDA